MKFFILLLLLWFKEILFLSRVGACPLLMSPTRRHLFITLRCYGINIQPFDIQPQPPQISIYTSQLSDSSVCSCGIEHVLLYTNRTVPLYISIFHSFVKQLFFHLTSYNKSPFVIVSASDILLSKKGPYYLWWEFPYV